MTGLLYASAATSMTVLLLGISRHTNAQPMKPLCKQKTDGLRGPNRVFSRNELVVTEFVNSAGYDVYVTNVGQAGQDVGDGLMWMVTYPAETVIEASGHLTTFAYPDYVYRFWRGDYGGELMEEFTVPSPSAQRTGRLTVEIRDCDPQTGQPTPAPTTPRPSTATPTVPVWWMNELNGGIVPEKRCDTLYGSDQYRDMADRVMALQLQLEALTESHEALTESHEALAGRHDALKRQVDRKFRTTDEALADRVTITEIDQYKATVSDSFDQRYKKTEVDDLLAKIDAKLWERYTKGEADARFTGIKTTLIGLQERYTKSEVDNKLATASAEWAAEQGATMRTWTNNNFWTRSAADGRYAPKLSTQLELAGRYTKIESDQRMAAERAYSQKTLWGPENIKTDEDLETKLVDFIKDHSSEVQLVEGGWNQEGVEVTTAVTSFSQPWQKRDQVIWDNGNKVFRCSGRSAGAWGTYNECALPRYATCAFAETDDDNNRCDIRNNGQSDIYLRVVNSGDCAVVCWLIKP